MVGKSVGRRVQVQKIERIDKVQAAKKQFDEAQKALVKAISGATVQSFQTSLKRTARAREEVDEAVSGITKVVLAPPNVYGLIATIKDSDLRSYSVTLFPKARYCVSGLFKDLVTNWPEDPEDAEFLHEYIHVLMMQLLRRVYAKMREFGLGPTQFGLLQ